MIIDMDKFRRVTGTELPAAPQEPASPYEGRSFAQLMMQDIPKWSSAMDLSIAKGDLAKAREYNDLIEGASTKYSDDWMQFARFSGNHPIGARMRDGAMQLMSGELGINKFNQALASEEVQGRAIDTMYGPGALAQTIKASRNRTDPVAAAQSTELLQAIGAPIMTPGAVEDVEVADPYTGQKTVKRRPVQPLTPATQDELNNRHDFVTKGLSVDGVDEGFMKSVGGVSGYASNALKLQSIGGSAADDLLQFTRETTSKIADPAERAAAWASTVDMTARTMAKLNPSKDPLTTRTISGLLKTTRDALGEQGFSMKEAPVVASIQKVLDINKDVVDITGMPIPQERNSLIASAFAKRNARRELKPEEDLIIKGFDKAESLKAGVTLGATPGQPSGAEAFTMQMGADGKPVAVKNPALGGVDARHTLVKGYMDEALTKAPSIAAATGQPFDVVLKDTMEDMLSERMIQMVGGKTPDTVEKFGKNDAAVVEQFRRNKGVTVTDTADGGYEVKSPGMVVNRDMARGMSRLVAARMLEKGSFDVNNLTGEIMSIPEIGQQLALETQAALRRSAEAGNATPELKTFGKLAGGSMKSSFGKGVVDAVMDGVTGETKSVRSILTWDGTGVYRKTLSTIRDRVTGTEVANAWKANTSDAFNFLADNVAGTEELKAMIMAEPGKNQKLDAAAQVFQDQVLKASGGDFFNGGAAKQELSALAYDYAKRQAVELAFRFRDNEKAKSGLGAGGVTLGDLLGSQRANWDTETTSTGFGRISDPHEKRRMILQITGGAGGSPLEPIGPSLNKTITPDRPDFSEGVAKIITDEIAGDRAERYDSGEALYTQMLVNLHQRSAKRVAPAPTQQVAQPGAPVNVELLRELPLDKTSMANILRFAQMADAANDESIVYKNAESMLDSLNDKNYGPYAAETRAKGQTALKDIKTRPFSEIMKDFTKAQEEGGTKYRKMLSDLKLQEKREELVMRQEVENSTAGLNTSPPSTGGKI